MWAWFVWKNDIEWRCENSLDMPLQQPLMFVENSGEEAPVALEHIGVAEHPANLVDQRVILREIDADHPFHFCAHADAMIPIERAWLWRLPIIDTPPAQAGRFSGYAQPTGSR